MYECNNKEYADKFCDMIDELMNQFEYVGDYKWGDPAGQSEGISTYEIIADVDKKVWCSLIEYVNAGTGEPNRKGIIASFPVEGNRTLGSVMSTMIPYYFKRTFNTRAFCEDDHYEIRNYGKLTVGRTGLKQADFFAYVNEKYPGLCFLDEEDKPYIKVYEYNGSLGRDEFAKQTYAITKLLAEYKEKYRV